LPGIFDGGSRGLGSIHLRGGEVAYTFSRFEGKQQRAAVWGWGEMIWDLYLDGASVGESQEGEGEEERRNTGHDVPLVVSSCNSCGQPTQRYEKP